MRKMGIDWGLRRVGLALSDEESAWAFPHRTLERSDDRSLLGALCEELRKHEVGEVVLGLPLRMNGREGPEAARMRKLKAELERAAGIPVVLWDERLTTYAAERALRAAEVRPTRKQALRDQAAATLLLQSYLDARQQAR